MTTTFYFAPNSTASTVHWSLEELQIPYEAIQVDITDAADKLAKLGPVNPNGLVPVLVHEGVAIFESAAIQIYLGETFGVDKGLFPKPGPARGHALKWLVWANVSLGAAIGHWFHDTQGDGAKPDSNSAVAKKARKDIDRLIAMLDADLGEKPYILGESISLVDFHLVSLLGWAAYCGIDLAPFPKVAKWVGTCSARPAQQKLMAA